jgi:hypothetical protein
MRLFGELTYAMPPQQLRAAMGTNFSAGAGAAGIGKHIDINYLRCNTQSSNSENVLGLELSAPAISRPEAICAKEKRKRSA